MLGKFLIAVVLLSSAPAQSTVTGPPTRLTGNGTGEFVYDPVALTVTSVGTFKGTSEERTPGKPRCCASIERTGSYVLTLKLAGQFEIKTTNVSYLFKNRGYRDSVAIMSQRIVGFDLEVRADEDEDFMLFAFERDGGSMPFDHVNAIGYCYNANGQGPCPVRTDRYNPWTASPNRTTIVDGEVQSDLLDLSTRAQFLEVSMHVVPTVLKASYDDPYNGIVTDPFSVGGSWSLYRPVPEPSTWAMAILGFGAVGAALRRSRRTAGGKAAESA